MNCKQQRKLHYASAMVIRLGHLIYVIRIYMTEQEISFKKLYDEETDDIFDRSYVRIFKEIERKKMEDVYTL